MLPEGGRSRGGRGLIFVLGKPQIKILWQGNITGLCLGQYVARRLAQLVLKLLRGERVVEGSGLPGHGGSQSAENFGGSLVLCPGGFQILGIGEGFSRLEIVQCADVIGVGVGLLNKRRVLHGREIEGGCRGHGSEEGEPSEKRICFEPIHHSGMGRLRGTISLYS